MVAGSSRWVRARQVGFAAVLSGLLSLAVPAPGQADLFDDIVDGVKETLDDTSDFIEGASEPSNDATASQPDETVASEPEATQTGQTEAVGATSSDEIDFSHVEMTMEAQDRLNQLGYDAGPIDGQAGAKTAAAVSAFQSDNGLVADGDITPALIAVLRQAQAQQADATASQQSSETALASAGDSDSGDGDFCAYIDNILRYDYQSATLDQFYIEQGWAPRLLESRCFVFANDRTQWTTVCPSTARCLNGVDGQTRDGAGDARTEFLADVGDRVARCLGPQSGGTQSRRWDVDTDS